jgi:starch synthase
MNPNDIQKYSPKSDVHLFHRYDLKTIGNKKKNKQDFFQKQKENPFTLLVLSENLSDTEEKILEQLLEGIASLPAIQIVIVGEGKKTNLSFHYISSVNKGLAFAVSDAMILFPSQTKTLFSELLIAMKYGTIPIVPEDNKTKNVIRPFDPVNEKGNGFLFQKNDVWNMFDAIIRAKENYRFPYDWENLVRACMEN